VSQSAHDARAGLRRRIAKKRVKRIITEGLSNVVEKFQRNEFVRLRPVECIHFTITIDDLPQDPQYRLPP
jgi:hypothetical protein